MSEIRELAQKVIRDFDNESCYVILTSAAMISYLEEPINRARFFNYNKELELYFDSKDLNRFSRVKDLTKRIQSRIKAKSLTGFERYLKSFRENKVMIREKEGPSEGMAWKGFGGVHSHYDLTPLGKALLVFHSTLRSPGLNLHKLPFSEDWDQFLESEINHIIQSVASDKLRVKYTDNCFFAKRIEASYITQIIFEFIAGASQKITKDEIRNFIFDKAGEIHIGEIPGSIERLKPLLKISDTTVSLNARGRFASIGYANLIVETALTLDDTEIVHYMISAKNLVEGSKKILENYVFNF